MQVSGKSRAKVVVGKTFHCPADGCSVQYKTLGRYWNHLILKHGDEWKFRCTHCGQPFTLKFNLDRHVTTLHEPAEQPKYQCEACDFSSTRSDILAQHVKNKHSGARPFACTECGKSFKRKCTLDEHVAQHNAQSRPCSKGCGKSYTHPKSLKRHEKTCTHMK